MNIYLAIVLFIVGIVLVVKGGDFFVDAASWIARSANIPSFIVGATIVSFATTLPEMLVSVMASIDGKNDMAVGNAVGSVTANTAMIMAIAMIFMRIIAKRKEYIKQSLLLVITAFVLWAGCLSGRLASWASVVLIVIFVLFMIINVQNAKNHPEENEDSEPINKKDMLKNILMFIIGAIGIVVGSNFLINGGSAIATAIGVPERVIAVTMVAIGTSLPELVTTVTAITKKQSSLSIGNIIGANIIDLSLILPVCTFVSKGTFAVSETCLKLDLPVCLAVTLIAIIPIMIKEKAYKAQGILLLIVYAAYIFVTV